MLHYSPHLKNSVTITFFIDIFLTTTVVLSSSNARIMFLDIMVENYVRSLSQYYLHNEIIPYRTFSMFPGYYSHIESSDLQSGYVESKEVQVHLSIMFTQSGGCLRQAFSVTFSSVTDVHGFLVFSTSSRLKISL